MSSIRRLDFSDVQLYAVSSDVKDEDLFLSQVDLLLKGGVDAIQLRAKSLSDKRLIELGKKLKEKCEKADALFLINNRPDLALAIEADGVHLGHEDGPISLARQILGHRVVIGASTHSLPQALEAQRAGADYVSCGPVWATPTKPDYAPVGEKLIGFYRAALKIPFVAIGGIDESNIDQVLAAGASRVAVVRALFESGNTEAAAKLFKEKIVGRMLVKS